MHNNFRKIQGLLKDTWITILQLYAPLNMYLYHHTQLELHYTIGLQFLLGKDVIETNS